MKRRKWTAEKKAKIVLEGIKGRPIAEICTDYHISQAQYYQWRDVFLSHMGKAFDTKQQGRRETYLQQQNGKLKRIIGEMTVKLKKTTGTKRSSSAFFEDCLA